MAKPPKSARNPDLSNIIGKLNDLTYRNQLILDTTLDGFILADDKGKVIEVNAAYCNMMGFDEQEVLGMNIMDLEGTLSEEEIAGRIAFIVENGGAQFETSHVKKDGSRLYFNVSLTAMEEGGQQLVAAFCRDITPQKTIEAELKKSKEVYKRIVEDQKVLVVRWVGEGIITFANRAYCDFIGIPMDEIKGQSFFPYLNENQLKNLKNETKQLTPENPSAILVFTTEFPDTNPFVMEWENRGVFDENGDIFEFQTEGRDVTQRKIAEQKLIKSEQQFRSLYNQSPDMLLSVSAKDAKIIFCNDTLVEKTGFSKDEIIGKTIHKIYADEKREKVDSIFKKFTQEGKLRNEELLLTRKDGSQVDISLNVEAIRNSKGEILSSISVLRDISEWKKAEKELRDSEEHTRQLFNQSAVIIWEEDFSEVKKMAISLKKRGVKNFEAYLEKHPEKLVEMAGSIKLIKVNQKSLDFYEVSSMKELETNIANWFVEESYICFREEIAALCSGALTFDGEIPVKTPKGEMKYLYLSLKVPEQYAETLERVYVSFVDITERKKAMQSLEESENKFHSLFSLANDAILVLEENIVIDCNDKTLEVFGYDSRKEFLELAIADLLPPLQPGGIPSSDEVEKHFIQLLEKRAPILEFMVLKKKGGIIFDAEISASPLVLNDKVFVQAIIRDITPHKEAQKKLQDALAEVEELKTQLEIENEYLQEEIKSEVDFENMVFRSQEFESVLKQVGQVATVDANVLILGETGTGKELIARAIHNLSNRKDRPLVKVNCAALPRELIESELFGHEAGAFTGANKQKVGRFELAENGTLFLDEIGELPLELQPKLLRVLQEGEFERLGGTKTISLDVRIIAATNRNLEAEVKKGTFREDLFYRLHVFPIMIPPLRERKADIFPLATFFLEKYAIKFNKQFKPIQPTTFSVLENYSWPGNVRELENLVERALILSENGVLPFAKILGVEEDEPTEVSENEYALKTMERKHILHVLKASGWKINGVEGAAEKLELTPTTVRDRMKKLGISRPK